MTTFVIERAVPGAKDMTSAQLREIAHTFNAAVASLGVPYRWVATYVAGDKLYCLHEAEDAEAVAEQTRRTGYPAAVITAVAAELRPESAVGGPR